jgi:hypothetical protein
LSAGNAYDPPYEQWLIGVGVGAVSSFVDLGHMLVRYLVQLGMTSVVTQWLYKVGYVPFWVSRSTGLPASVLAFLELLNSLTSFLYPKK